MRYLLLFSLLVGYAPLALAQHDPLSGADRFPQFRNLSGLAGGGFGVDEQGFQSLSGPTAYSTPNAHVLGRGQLRIGGAKTSLGSRPEISNGKTNGTFMDMVGFTFGRVNLAWSELILSGYADKTYQLQASYIPDSNARWVGSIGVQDWAGNGGSAGNGIPGDSRTSMSIFGVATYRVPTRCVPLYVSAGVGTRRFKQGFASASAQVLKPVRAWVEHDGFGINAGILVSYNLRERGPRSIQINGMFGYIQQRYPTVSIAVGF